MEPVHYLLIVVAVLVIAGGGFLLARGRAQADTAAAEPGAEPTVRRGLAAALRRSWTGGLDDQTWESFEETLLAADVGVGAATDIVAAVRKTRPESFDEALAAVTAEVRAQFADAERSVDLGSDPAVIVVVGVNGSGKTTTIAKLARMLTGEGRSVVLAAADTFRAAAADQLVVWGERLGVRVVRGGEGADPASVVHDALTATRAGGSDLLIVDTAGRLHGKKNLMAELEKIHRVATEGGRLGAEVLLVLDATSGQNGLVQVKEFALTVPVTGVVLTKLDGTARGGIVVAVERELGVPIKYVGTGEGLDDLSPFDPVSFADDLLEA